MKKQKIAESAKNITIEILEALDTFLGAFLLSAGSSRRLYRELNKQRPDIDRDTFYHNLHSMNRRKLINYDHHSDSVEFTNKGLLKVVEKVCKKFPNDKIFRFVSFDIPEDFSTRRDKFRSTLKRIGFKNVQKSLWVINKDASSVVEIAAYECQVEKYISYIVSASSDIDGILIKMFRE
ncbi:MAG: hypothetical protein NTW79_03975 [Candidatus Berkelbacteria bacterium]|nr:hypothetical protein [Candidatus Berkelbacteria bacterium]